MTSPTIDLALIQPNWPSVTSVQACTTTRQGGVSLPPYDALNLAYHVQDNPQAVSQNRQLLAQRLKLTDIVWLDQQHTTDCLYVDCVPQQIPVTDAVWTDQPGLVLAVMTADCLPILLTNGKRICAIHAGWRGLLDGIIENSLKQCVTRPGDGWQAWIGPAISAEFFEVGDEVRQAFVQKHPTFDQFFQPHGDKWLADLAAMAEQILRLHGIQNVTQSNLCSYADSDRFYSYRRDQTTGRMASLIWINTP
ncbi:MAG: peptidoglycan editing factor PgeF [Thiomicrospira sp.]|nr:peptidoglycan editing factor PgeF [Thiomicrospira sp.]